MAWNNPPKIEYDQSGSKLSEHRYVPPNLGQATNMLHQPVMNQQIDQFNNYGLNMGLQPQNNTNVPSNVPASTIPVPYQNNLFYQDQQHNQPSTLQIQPTPDFNQFQNHSYQQQPAPYLIFNQQQNNDPQQQQILQQQVYYPSESIEQQQPVNQQFGLQEQDTVQPVESIGQPIQNEQNLHSGQQNQTRYNAPTVDACSSIVQSLSRHICGDTDFCRRAIESLVKKMKEKRDELDALITAVTTSGAVPTSCVTIQRTLDGRLQVAGKKGFPHVIYAKIWRWPDLTRNELKPIRTCQYGFNMNADLICVNPYHYDRVVATPGSSSYEDSNIYDCELSPLMSNVISDYDSPPAIVEQNQTMISSPNRLSQLSTGPSDQQVQMDLMTIKGEPITNVSQQYLPKHGTTTSNSTTQTSTSATTSRYLSQIPSPEFWCTISYFELDQQVGESFRTPWHLSSVTIDGYTDPSATDRFCLGYVNNDHRSPDVQKARLHIGPGVKLVHVDGNVFLENLSNQAVFLNSPYQDYEHRKFIGGAVIKITPKCKVEVFNLKHIHAMLSERAETARQAAAAQAAAVAGTQVDLPGNITNSDQLEAAAAIGVDDLRRYCVFSISFVKGWGPQYKKRITIKQCPCWVEITMHRALQLLDDLLRYRL